MLRERGYPGGPDHFRHLVALQRPRPPAESFLRLRTLPGEQAQVDWGAFGRVAIGRAERRLSALVMVLSWSRALFLRFFLHPPMASFWRGHVEAFEHFGGAVRVVLYDNLRSAVLERVGDAIRFHPELLALATHYGYEPRPVAIARGNEKGRVERAIQYVRTAFFAARPCSTPDHPSPAAPRTKPSRSARPSSRSRRSFCPCHRIRRPPRSASRSRSGAPPTCASTATTTPCLRAASAADRKSVV